MEEERFSIVNEQGLTIHGVIIRPKLRGSFPLAVLAGDFFDTAESPSIKEAAKLLLEEGFAIVQFDFTNGMGKSEGRIEDITISQRARDLQLVIEYAKRRAYVNERRVVVLGFGFGAMAALVLEGFHNLARALVLVNTPRAVDDTAWTRFDDREMLRVRLKRYFHISRGGEEVRINYTLLEDGYRTDMARCARNLKTPTLYLTGGDPVVPPEHSAWLAERTPAPHDIAALTDGRKLVKEAVQRALEFFKKQKI